MRNVSFILLFAMMVSSVLEVSGQAAPKSQLKSVYYRVSGGMLPGDQEYIDLRREKDGRLMLTVKGDCMNEKVTFEVPEEVFAQCDSLIHETELYKSEGFYRTEFPILDAPSLDFSVRYADSNENFSAGGFVPASIGEGIRVVARFLYGLRGDREAVGHLKRINDLRDEAFMQVVWTDGNVTYEPDSTGVEELFEFLCEELEMDYEYHEWQAWRMAGSGFNCLVVRHEGEGFMDVFVDEKTREHQIRKDETIAGEWPETARRPLLGPELEEIETERLQLMQAEIENRYEDTYRTPMTDLERLNWELIDWELRWRKQH